MKQLNKTLVGGVALMVATLVGGIGEVGATVFEASDVIDGEIQFNYNSYDNLHYLNGVSTGKNFDQTVDSRGSVGRWASPDEGIIASTGVMGTSQDFIYGFVMPTGYTISSLSVESRLIAFDGCQSNNHLRLFVSTDNSNWYEFNSITTDANNIVGTWPTTNLSAYVIGATQYYIKGVFDFDGATETALYKLQIFRDDASGGINSVFKNSIGVVAVPEPASLVLLLAGGLLAFRRKRC